MGSELVTVFTRILCFGAGAALLLTACERRREFRHYSETVIAAPAMHGVAEGGATEAPTAGALAWTVPEGWQERPGNGMRLASFGVGDVECTIIAFPGDAGGLESNLARWLRQLGIESTTDVLAKMSSATESVTTEGGGTAQLFDFTAVLPATATTNMLSALLPTDDQTVFVKLMGPRALLEAQKKSFRSLCQSLRPR